MPAPPCPKCRAQTVYAGYDPWCPSCGWNREVAGDRLRRASRSIPFYYLLSVVFFGVFFHVWKSPRPFTLLLVFVFPLVPLVLLYAALRWSRSRFARDVADAASGVRPAATAVANPPAPRADGEFRMLQEMPRPRPVRLSRRGKINLTVAMTGVAGFAVITGAGAYRRIAAAGSVAVLSRADWIWLAFVFVLTWIPFFTWKNVRRQKDLMAHGEVALARVLRRMGDRSSPTIQYEFEDAQGQKASGMASDTTRSLYDGMSVVVFYDAQNPRRHAAQCECFCEVVLPGRE